jgi:hypothetical protein
MQVYGTKDTEDGLIEVCQVMIVQLYLKNSKILFKDLRIGRHENNDHISKGRVH